MSVTISRTRSLQNLSDRMERQSQSFALRLNSPTFASLTPCARAELRMLAVRIKDWAEELHEESASSAPKRRPWWARGPLARVA